MNVYEQGRDISKRYPYPSSFDRSGTSFGQLNLRAVLLPAISLAPITIANQRTIQPSIAQKNANLKPSKGSTDDISEQVLEFLFPGFRLYASGAYDRLGDIFDL